MADEVIIPGQGSVPVTTPDDKARHHQMGAELVQKVEEGKATVPDVREPLVCKPRQLEPWRVFKIMSEFVEGFEIIQKYSLAATVFGSTRIKPGDPLYEAASQLAGKLAKKGFAIITGGSAGIMEAANKGAFEAGGASIGLNIHLNSQQAMNQYVTEQTFFDHFFVRKVMLTFASEAYIYFPGGFGTMDEFYEIVTLIQTGKIKKIPVVLFGKEYWTPVIARFKEQLLEEYGYISPEDMDIFTLAETVDEAYDHIVATTRC